MFQLHPPCLLSTNTNKMPTTHPSPDQRSYAPAQTLTRTEIQHPIPEPYRQYKLPLLIVIKIPVSMRRLSPAGADWCRDEQVLRSRPCPARSSPSPSHSSSSRRRLRPASFSFGVRNGRIFKKQGPHKICIEASEKVVTALQSRRLVYKYIKLKVILCYL